MTLSLLDSALQSARVHPCGQLARIVLDGNGQIVCGWRELYSAMRWASARPPKPRSDASLSVILERVETWISSQCSSIPPKGAPGVQQQLLRDLISAGQDQGLRWRAMILPQPQMSDRRALPRPGDMAMRPLIQEVDNAHSAVADKPAAAPAPAQFSNPRPDYRAFTKPADGRRISEPDIDQEPADLDQPPPHWQRVVTRLRGSCAGQIVEEVRGGGLHIEMSGDLH